MRTAALYSHHNGQEHILAHRPHIWAEIEELVAAVDASGCRVKASEAKSRQGRALCSPAKLKSLFEVEFKAREWQPSRASYWAAREGAVVNRIMELPGETQREEILKAGLEPVLCHKQMDFVKQRVAVVFQFGECAAAAYDLFVKHMAFFVGDQIDVGVEILPMKELQAEMSSGVGYYEGELYNLLRQGRGVPAVPLVLIGVAA